MRSTRATLFLLISLLFITQSNASTQKEIDKAFSYFQNRDEVYISFNVASLLDIDRFHSIVTIDKVECGRVYAYANKRQFNAFQNTGHPFILEIPPGMAMSPPEMSDYDTPEKRLHIDRYPTYKGYLNLMESFENDYPELCKLHEIGSTVKNRKLLVLQVTDNIDEREAEPKFFHSSTIHGDETAGYMITLRMIDYLLSQYGRNARVSRIVDSTEIWFCPLMNPDGTYKGSNNTVFGSQRYNANGADLNRDYPAPPAFGTADIADRAQVETEACKAFERRHNFVLSIDNHGGIEAAFYPWSIKSTKTVDDDWFRYVCREFADEVHENSPSSHFTGAGGDGWGNWNQEMYYSKGTRPDWQYRFRHCREITVELSSTKTLSESNFDNWWSYHRDPCLTFYERMFHGIRGLVTDSLTGEGLPAKVYIEDHDDDSSHVYADMPHGNYYRPIYSGTYDVTFSCKDYFEKTIEDVSVQNDEATILDVQLISKITGTVAETPAHTFTLTVLPHRGGVRINSNSRIYTAAIYTLSGALLYSFPESNNHQLVWNGRSNNGIGVGSGCYIVKINSDNGTRAIPVFCRF